jgi:membrane-associated phospholipid phosphatase
MTGTGIARRATNGLRAKLTTEERFVPATVRRNLYVTSAVLMIVGGLLFVSLVVQVMAKIGIVALDQATETQFVLLRTPFLTTVNDVLAVVFGPISMPIVVFVVTVTWIIFSKHAWRPLVLAASMTLGVVLIQIITRLVQRPRPPLDLMLFGRDTTYSFPSGHVCGVSDFFLITSYLVISRAPKVGRIVVCAVVSVVGISSQVLSRVYLGYHWLSDTLSSVCLSLVILGLVIAVDTRRTVRVPGEMVTGELSKVQTENT